MKYNKKLKWVEHIFAIIGFIATIFALYSLVPQISIKYYPEYKYEYFGIYNKGNYFPLTSVQYSYEVSCQNISTNSIYIKGDILPCLTPLSLDTEEFDNLTASVLKNALILNKDKCKENSTMTEISFNALEFFKTSASNNTIDLYFCDKCKLIINVTSNETKPYHYEYDFINPLKVKLFINCTNPWMESQTLIGKGCVYSFASSEDNIYVPPRSFYVKLSEDRNYIILGINQSLS